MSTFIWIFFVFGIVIMNVYSSEALADSDLSTWISMLIQIIENLASILLNLKLGNIGSIIVDFMMVVIGLIALIIRCLIGDKFERSLSNFTYDIRKVHRVSNSNKNSHKMNKFIRKIRSDVIAIDDRKDRIKLKEILPSLRMLYDYMNIPKDKKDYRSLVVKFYDLCRYYIKYIF